MAYQGISLITIEQILEDISFALVEPIVDTVSQAVVLAGLSIVTPASMEGIYVGAKLLIGVGNNLEQVVVAATSQTTFSATVAFSHIANEPVVGATFPSGVPDNPLFTQDEVIGYLADVQNDLLLKTRCIFGVTGAFTDPPNIPFVVNQRVYPQPPNAIRVERVAAFIVGKPTIDLMETTQSDLDLDNFFWTADAGTPQMWFRDQADTGNFGLSPMPNVKGALELLFSKRGPVGNVGVFSLLSTFLIPDVMSHYLKYGVLEKCWSKDGETRDPSRAEYCKKRYQFGIVLIQRFMEGIGIDTGAAQQSYSPMALPAGA